jgi:hypothetical protein
MSELQKIFSTDPFFWFFALVGSGMFVIQFLLSLFGFTDDHTHDISDDIHGHADAHGFKWITKQTLTGFLMFFGWVGLTCRKEFSFSNFSSAVYGVIGGLAAVFATALIFKLAKKMHNPGAVFKIEDTVGKEAIVYQRIPKDGSGKISLSLYQQTYEIDAVSLKQEEVPSFSHVHILKIENDKTVSVILKR